VRRRLYHQSKRLLLPGALLSPQEISQGNHSHRPKARLHFYHMLKHKHEYREPDPVACQAKFQNCRFANLKKLASMLGFDLVTTTSTRA
jgi:hypothetical protein